MTPDKILAMALKKETQARDFYTRLAADCHVEFVRELLNTLAAEESRHVRMVEDISARLGSDSRLSP